MASVINFNAFKNLNEKEKAKTSVEIFYLMVDRLGIEESYQKCCVCGWTKATVDLALMLPAYKQGEYKLDNVVPLCPNHNKLFLLAKLEHNEWLQVGRFLWTTCNMINPFSFN